MTEPITLQTLDLEAKHRVSSLFRAATCSPADAEESLEAVAEACRSLALQEDWSAPERKLLPWIYSRWRKRLSGPFEIAARKAYHAAWAKNKVLAVRLERTIDSLTSLGIRTAVLKGAAMIHGYYADPACRPMADYDILVPEERIDSVITAMCRAGWTPSGHAPGALNTPYFYRYRHAVQMIHPELGEADIHWHVLYPACFRGADRAFWDHAVPVQIGGASTLTLSTTDHLLHALVHAFGRTDSLPVQALADAALILQSHGASVDWERLVRVTRDLRIAVPVRTTLMVLAALPGIDVPADVLVELRTIRVGRLEACYFSQVEAGSAPQGWRAAVYTLQGFRRATRDLPLYRSIRWLPEHIRLDLWSPSLGLTVSRGLMKVVGIR